MNHDRLLFRDAIVAHALSRLGEFVQGILASDVDASDDSCRDRESCSIAIEPVAHAVEHNAED